MIFVSQNHFKLISVRNMIQVIDSIPWVRCASGNVFIFCLKLVFNFFFSTFFPIFFQLVFNLPTFFNSFATFSQPLVQTFYQLFCKFFADTFLNKITKIFNFSSSTFLNFFSTFFQFFLNFFSTFSSISIFTCISSNFGHQRALHALAVD